MRKIYFILTCLCFTIFTLFTAKADEARLMRFPAINQDQIVFTYAGDLYTVSHEGGVARKLTSHNGLEIFPRFSPDGSQIAFTGQFDGNTEVYSIPSQGGIPRRLTYTATLDRDDLGDRMGPNNIVMNWTPDGEIVYRSRKQTFNSFKGQLFKVPAEGGMSQQIEVPEGGFLSFSNDGNKMAYNRVFREFRTWKYYQGGMADNIWVHDFETKETINITDNPAQDLMPMWIGDNIYFISDRDHTMNLFKYNLNDETVNKVTHFEKYDIKFPSHFNDLIVFENGGYIYTFDTNSEDYQKVEIQIQNDQNFSRAQKVDAADRIFSADLSPNGERVLFSARGDLFSVPSNEGITYNLTRSSDIFERNGVWCPNGEYFAYLSDKSGEYEIWVDEIKGDSRPMQLTQDGEVYKFNIAWSPDGKKIAWNDQLYGLYITDIANSETTKLAKSDYTPIRDFNWSPDSRWISYTDYDKNRMGVINIVDVESGEVNQVTEKWHNSQGPSFSNDGKYLFFASDRTFNPIYSQSEWNHAYINMGKIYMILLDKETQSPFAPKNDQVKPKPENDNQKENDNDKKNDNEVYTVIDFENITNRIIELPVDPANYYSISCVDNIVYYNKAYQSGTGEGGLAMFDLNEKKETLLGSFRYSISANNNKMLVGSNKEWTVLDMPVRSVEIDNKLDLSQMKTLVNYKEEWQQIFNEAWRQMRDFFYVENMHGVDWQEIYNRYKPLVKHVNHRTDLNYVIGEMIGELNAGHAYVNPGDQPEADRIKTGLLGAQISTHESGYFQIDKILEGASWSSEVRSPLNEADINVNEGEYIIAVDRVPANSVNDLFKLLKGKAETTVEITVNNTPSPERARNILITPIADESSLYYHKWVQDNIKKVNEATNGRVGYLHIPDMGPTGLNEFVKHFYPQLHKEALIVDDRGNGGGNVSPMILERLSRVPYRVNMRRNSPAISTIPAQTLAGPMVALIDKYSASDGDLFAHGFKELKLGKTIGTQTWGGIVGITGSLPFIDGTDLRIPQFTSLSMEGEWMIEGVGVKPDIEIENDPYREYKGIDDQLNKAIEVIMEKLELREELPDIPEDPVKSE
ncbi:S41 family peptidase [Marinilabiliaceae bacterium ANBcel2]|nr:S41 family peptidase [Marinilabiliaceae bacterium ANBcel2]